MPNYDFGCSKCDFVLRDLFLPLSQHRDKITADCPNHGLTTFEQVLTCPVIEDWGNEGPDGRFFEHLGPKGMRFRDKAAYKRHLRENGLVEWAPRTGMPGSGV
jgi:hypothetical protein